MIAYRHLNLPAPPINVPPTITEENRDRTYVVRLHAPRCEMCHQRHTVVAHRLYVILYSQRPFLCLHRHLIEDMEVAEERTGPPVFLPARIERVVPDHASQSSGGSVNVDKILQDMRNVSSTARAAIDYFRTVENEVRRERYDLSSYPELAISQVYRMRAMIAAGAEDARQDLELR